MDFRSTITPKSDQLNFEDVKTGNITARIKSVKAGDSQQPVFIELVGFDGRPYKPSKSMRRILINGWGSNGHDWVGKYLELKGDRNIKYAGIAVGGITIHGMSDLDGDFSMMLTEKRGTRKEHRVVALDSNLLFLNDFIFKSKEMNTDVLNKSFDMVKNKLSGDESKLKLAEQAYQEKLSAITNKG